MTTLASSSSLTPDRPSSSGLISSRVDQNPCATVHPTRVRSTSRMRALIDGITMLQLQPSVELARHRADGGPVIGVCRPVLLAMKLQELLKEQHELPIRQHRTMLSSPRAVYPE